MSKKTWLDPVEALGLEGQIVQAIPCPYMVASRRARSWRGARPCGMQAILFRYPDPYGYRSRCEDGHVVVLAATQIPGSYRPFKGETD